MATRIPASLAASLLSLAIVSCSTTQDWGALVGPDQLHLSYENIDSDIDSRGLGFDQDGSAVEVGLSWNLSNPAQPGGITRDELAELILQLRPPPGPSAEELDARAQVAREQDERVEAIHQRFTAQLAELEKAAREASARALAAEERAERAAEALAAERAERERLAAEAAGRKKVAREESERLAAEAAAPETAAPVAAGSTAQTEIGNEQLDRWRVALIVGVGVLVVLAGTRLAAARLHKPSSAT